MAELSNAGLQRSGPRPKLNDLPLELLIEILESSETLELFTISKTCRSIYMAAVCILETRMALMQRGPGFKTALRIREPITLSPPLYRPCRCVGREQVRLSVKRGHMARLCDVFFRMSPTLRDDLVNDEVTIKAVTISNALCQAELRHSPFEYSLSLMQHNACIQLLYTLQFLMNGKGGEHIAGHHGEIDIDKNWVEKLASSSKSPGTPGPARPSESIPRSEKARLAFPVLEDPSIAWDTLATVGFKLKARQIWPHDLDRATYMLKIEEIYIRAIPMLRWQDLCARQKGKDPR